MNVQNVGVMRAPIEEDLMTQDGDECGEEETETHDISCEDEMVDGDEGLSLEQPDVCGDGPCRSRPMASDFSFPELASGHRQVSTAMTLPSPSPSLTR